MARPLAERLDVGRLTADLSGLARIGANPAGGIDRPAYSQAFREAVDWLKDAMHNAGLRVHEDAAGNVIGRLGPPGPALVCGSHIDTVPQGGAYDGALGVLAALECARALRDGENRLKLGFEVIAFADEEGAYLSLLGSRAMTGQLSQLDVDGATGRRGDSLRDVMVSYGLDPASIRQSARPKSDFAGYIELHIEQGPVLEKEKTDIGVVDAIFGIRSDSRILTGAARHAGTTPFANRQDALRAAAEAIADSYHAVKERSDVRLTFGAIEAAPGASNVVPGLVRVTQEVRAADVAKVDEIRNLADGCFTARARENRVMLETRMLSNQTPTTLSSAMGAITEKICRSAGYSFRHMISGAGHDAQSFANICETGMIFVPSRNGISHHPDEYTESAAIAAALKVLFEVCWTKCAA